MLNLHFHSSKQKVVKLSGSGVLTATFPAPRPTSAHAHPSLRPPVSRHSPKDITPCHVSVHSSALFSPPVRTSRPLFYSSLFRIQHRVQPLQGAFLLCDPCSSPWVHTEPRSSLFRDLHCWATLVLPCRLFNLCEVKHRGIIGTISTTVQHT